MVDQHPPAGGPAAGNGSAAAASLGTGGLSCGPGGVLHKAHDRGVLLVRYVAAWRALLTVCYDNCLRVYDTESGELMHLWENEANCMFTDIEVDRGLGEVS